MIKEIDSNLKRIFLMNMGFATCYYLITPLFPLFLNTLKITEAEIGLILGIGSFSAVFSTIVSGYLSDKFGKKNIFYSSILLRSVSVLAVVYTKEWLMMIPLWITFNLSQSLFEPARLAYVGEKATQENIGKLYGVMNLAWPIAGILGPCLSGNLAETHGWNQVLFIAVAINSLGLIPLIAVEDSSSTKRMEKKASFDRKYLPELWLHFLFHLLITTAMVL
jgi:DHA1 family multidrug resistance protein-like MFS transporter